MLRAVLARISVGGSDANFRVVCVCTKFFFAYVQPFFSGRGCFLALSAAGHARGGGACKLPGARKIWAPAGLRGARYGRSKSRLAGSFRGIVFRGASAKQVHGNPKLSSFLFLLIFSPLFRSAAVSEIR